MVSVNVMQCTFCTTVCPIFLSSQVFVRLSALKMFIIIIIMIKIVSLLFIMIIIMMMLLLLLFLNVKL